MDDVESFVSKFRQILTTFFKIARGIPITILVFSTFAISIGLGPCHPFRHPHVIHKIRNLKERRHRRSVYLRTVYTSIDDMLHDVMRNVIRNRVVSCHEQLVCLRYSLPYRIYKYSIERTRKERDKRAQREAAAVRKCVFQRERKEQRGERAVSFLVASRRYAAQRCPNVSNCT